VFSKLNASTPLTSKRIWADLCNVFQPGISSYLWSSWPDLVWLTLVRARLVGKALGLVPHDIGSKLASVLRSSGHIASLLGSEQAAYSVAIARIRNSP